MTFTEQQLRDRLADELQAEGSLRTPQWRSAVERVPRHQFIPDFFRQVVTDAGVAWKPVTAEALPASEFMELAYQNQTWVTQLNQDRRPADAGDVIATGDPTSSSTLPGLVVAMLEDLKLADNDKVLEIGTGSGYSTALLCERVGSGNVVSVEADPRIAGSAAAAIRTAGYTPFLVTGDGLNGFADCAPYEKLIATCSVRSIPPAWITQTAPGGMILTTLSGWQYGSAYVRITVSGDGIAHGTFLPETYSLMLARPHLPPPANLVGAGQLDSVKPRPAKITLDMLDSWTARFIAQLATPDAQIVTRKSGDGPMIDYLIDSKSQSVASVTPVGNSESQVRESGPLSLWGKIEESIISWQQTGFTPLSEFRIDINPESQRVYVTGHETLSWHLPSH